MNIFDMDITGFDKLGKALDKLGKVLDEGTLGELLTNDFIRSCSGFANLDEMEKGSPVDGAEPHKIAAILETPEWDEWIKANTSYTNWANMLQEAIEHRAQMVMNRALK